MYHVATMRYSIITCMHVATMRYSCMHVATKRLYGHAHFSYSCMHVATKRLYGPAIFSRQDAVVIHASVQTSLIREAPACRHRPSAIVHQKLLFLFTCFIRFCTCFMHVLCAFIFCFYLFHACLVCFYLLSSTMDFPLPWVEVLRKCSSSLQPHAYTSEQSHARHVSLTCFSQTISWLLCLLSLVCCKHSQVRI